MTGRVVMMHPGDPLSCLAQLFNRIRQVASIHDYLSLPYSPSQTAARSVQPFLHSLGRIRHALHTRHDHLSPKFTNSVGGSGLHLRHRSLEPSNAPCPNSMSIESAVFFRIDGRYQRTDGRTDRQNAHVTAAIKL